MRFIKYSLVMTSLVFLLGCQTTQLKKDSNSESTQQIVSAIGTMTEGLTNQNISQQDLRNLAVQVQSDPKTKSAVQSINQALNAHQTEVKYCPIDGARFDASIDECPVHKVQLKYVQ